jgi:Na+-driven multidrug efflux pump
MAKIHDLTKGSLARHFLRLAVPAAIGMVFSTLYNVVDVFFAGLISTDAQAGLAISFQAFFVFVTIGFGLSSAMTALVGNAIGAKDTAEASKDCNAGHWFCNCGVGSADYDCAISWPASIGVYFDRRCLSRRWHGLFYHSAF